MSDIKRPPVVVVIGAGPAGTRAAQTLLAAGVSPVLIDEAPRAGGQIYRQPPAGAGFHRTKTDLYGFEASKAEAVHATIDRIAERIDYRPNTFVWGCGDGRLDTCQGENRQVIHYTHLLIASGASDRVFPFSGWTLPGVYTLGASQIALKAQGCAVGSRVVFAGSGPLLYLVAYQYAKAGADVAAVLETSKLSSQVRAVPRLLLQPVTFIKGLYYQAWLLTHGIRIRRGISLVRAEAGREGVTGITYRRGKTVSTIDCDAVGFGYGLRSETQLADLAGCRFAFDELNRAWLPVKDAAGRTSVPNVYLAGDGAGIAGADAAELAGRRAALAVLEDLGYVSTGEADSIEKRLRRSSAFRKGLEQAFPVPADVSKEWPDDMTVCRCEEVTAGTLRACIRRGEAGEMNRLKALTRVGMGRCQGRMCGAATAELLSAETGAPLQSLGRLRGQAPIKPIPVSVVAGSGVSTQSRYAGEQA